jgi:hypothetical protein
VIERFEARAVEGQTATLYPATLSRRVQTERDLGCVTGTPRLRRTRLTDKDRQLIGALAIARYLSNEQLHRLFYSGRTAKTMAKRLRSLAGQGRRGFAPPYLRRLSYRTHDGRYVDLWALTAAGYAVAHSVLGTPVKLPREDVGAAFREHTVALNELLVGLMAPSIGTYARAKQTSFRWLTSDVVRLPWRQYLQKTGRQRERAIFPDAMLELPAARRRLFLECETGTHSIVATTDEKPGSTLAKVQNYASFIRGFADPVKGETFYARKYPDGWTPDVLFLVRTAARAKSVTEAIERWCANGAGAPFAVRALTFDTARDELLRHIRGNASTRCRRDDATTAQHELVAAEITALRLFFNATVLAFKTARAKARARGEPVPEYPPRAEEVQALIERLQAASPGSLDSTPTSSP